MQCPRAPASPGLRLGTDPLACLEEHATLACMTTRAQDQLADLNEKSLRQAVHYMLQLAVEWHLHGAKQESGAKLLAKLVSALEKHRRERQEGSLDASLVTVRKAILNLVVSGTTEGALEERDKNALDEIGRLLHRAGVRKTTSEIASLLRAPLRKGAADGSSGDKLNDKLAGLAGGMQTSFRNEVQVKESDLEKMSTGKRHTRYDTERAAMDQEPHEVAMLAYAVHVLGIDEDTRNSILREFDPQWLPSYLDGEVDVAEATAEAKRVMAEKAAEKAEKTDGAPALALAQSPTVFVPPWLELALPLPAATPRVLFGKIDVVPADRAKLTRWAKASGSRRVRARVILSLADGQSVESVQADLGIDLGTLCLWHAAYRRGGTSALALAGPPGQALIDKKVLPEKRGGSRHRSRRKP